MQRIEQSGLIAVLADSLRKRGSWAGETHIQKAGYLLQELLGVPLNMKFILYKHGPFSFELRELLAEMEGEDFIKWEPKPLPYGPSIVPGKGFPALLAFARSAKRFHKQVDFISERLAKKNVTDLERLATALYVTLEDGSSERDRVARLTSLKPHIPTSESLEAVREIDNLKLVAAQNGLILEKVLQA
jgi:hypothetical protein